MSVELNSAVGGRYRVEVRDASSGELKTDTGWFDNLITNQGLDTLGTISEGARNIAYCRVGSGTAIPVVTNVGLQTPIVGYATYAWVSDTFTQLPNNVRKFAVLYRYNFSAGSLVGTIREITVGSSNSGNVSAFSRSLLKDVNGNPIEVTATSNDLVTVYYELSTYVTTEDTVTNVTIGGNPYTLTIRPIRVTASSFISWGSSASSYSVSRELYYVTSANIGTMTWDSTASVNFTIGSSSCATSNYVNGSYERAITLNIPNGSIVDMRALFIYTGYCLCGQWGLIFNTDVVKEANQKLDFVVKIRWGRYVA